MDVFLDRHGLRAEEVIAQVDDAFGSPLLIVTAGSVLAGFGNATSDLDIYVVVPEKVPSQLPVMAYPRKARVDVVFHDAEELTARYDEVRATPWPAPEATPGGYARRRKVLDSLARLGQGLALDGTAEWLDWQRRVATETTGWLADWYAVDAFRKRVAARQLLPHNPRLAALRAGDALLAALERRAVNAGEPYFKWKWVGEKLLRLGDEEGYRWLELAACAPVDPADCPAHVERVDEILTGLLADLDTTGWRVALRPAEGSRWSDFGESRLLSRWQMRTVSVPASSPAASTDSWDLAFDEPWHPDVSTLFAHDLIWLGIGGAR